MPLVRCACAVHAVLLSCLAGSADPAMCCGRASLAMATSPLDSISPLMTGSSSLQRSSSESKDVGAACVLTPCAGEATAAAAVACVAERRLRLRPRLCMRAPSIKTDCPAENEPPVGESMLPPQLLTRRLVAPLSVLRRHMWLSVSTTGSSLDTIGNRSTSLPGLKCGCTSRPAPPSAAPQAPAHSGGLLEHERAMPSSASATKPESPSRPHSLPLLSLDVSSPSNASAKSASATALRSGRGRTTSHVPSSTRKSPAHGLPNGTIGSPSLNATSRACGSNVRSAAPSSASSEVVPSVPMAARPEAEACSPCGATSAALAPHRPFVFSTSNTRCSARSRLLSSGSRPLRVTHGCFRHCSMVQRCVGSLASRLPSRCCSSELIGLFVGKASGAR
mmetsp:Transcript_18340/g.54713  ORF Transcript_18340/g.54713 Transcript_18340/m.54713 type:complete len:392 (-) Transcript_18340:1869-3044(-)|eukprot:244132-Chlamydomonas_euryale.AAC.10